MGLFRWAIVIVLAMIVGFFIYVDLNSDLPTDLGLENGKLKSCPDTSNCVSTQAQESDAQHFVEPIIYRGARKDVQLKIEAYFLDSGHAKLISSRLGYAHFEVETPLLRFKDDVEIYLPEGDQVLHVRSASRVGYDDLGANRKRVRQLQELLVD